MEKRGLSGKKPVSSDIDSSYPKKDEDFKVFNALLKSIKEKYHICSSDILFLLEEDVKMPCSAFNDILSPLETIVKYLKENVGLENSKIAKLLLRDSRTIWQAYKHAYEKMPEPLKITKSEYSIPFSALRSELSILESIVYYLKNNYDLSFHVLGESIKRDERTIWTVYSRAKKKLKNAS